MQVTRKEPKMRITAGFGVLLVLPLLPVVRAQDEAERVGRYGDPALLRFVGAESFAADEIRRALRGNLDFVAASHPAAPLDGFLEITRESVEIGYLEAGFGKVEVRAEIDRAAGLVVVTVKEGIRYRWGDLRVRGVPNSVTLTLLHHVKRGEFARLAPASRADARRSVEAAFRAVGWFFTGFSLETVLDDESALAHVTLCVEYPGFTEVQKDVEVVGNETISKEDLVSFLALESLTAIDARAIDSIRDRLWRSGRFSKHDVEVLPPAGGERVRIRITLEEIEDAPPLSGELTTLEQTLLNLAIWLSTLADRDEDLVVEWAAEGQGKASFILSPRRGLLIALDSARKPIHHALLLSRDRAALCSFASGRYLGARSPDAGLGAFLRITPLPAAERSASGPYSKVNFGVNWSSGRTAPFTADIRVAPAALLAASGAIRVVGRVDEGRILVLEREGMRLSVESATGRLVRIGDAVVRSERGALDRARLALESATAYQENAFDPARPLSSSAGFLLEETVRLVCLAQEKPRSAKAIFTALRPFLEAGVLTPFDRLLPPGEEDTFTIPLQGTLEKKVFDFLGGHIARVLGELLPRDSWAALLSAGVVLAFTGRGEYTEDTLRAIAESEDVGPVGLLCVGLFLEDQAPHIVASLAKRGLSRLEPEWFRAECRTLVDGDSILTDCVLRIVTAARELTPRQIVEIVGTLDKESGQILVRVLHRLRADRPAREAAVEALAMLWEPGIREWVEEELGRLASTGGTGD